MPTVASLNFTHTWQLPSLFSSVKSTHSNTHRHSSSSLTATACFVNVCSNNTRSIPIDVKKSYLSLPIYHTPPPTSRERFDTYHICETQYMPQLDVVWGPQYMCSLVWCGDHHICLATCGMVEDCLTPQVCNGWHSFVTCSLELMTLPRTNSLPKWVYKKQYAQLGVIHCPIEFMQHKYVDSKGLVEIMILVRVTGHDALVLEVCYKV